MADISALLKSSPVAREGSSTSGSGRKETPGDINISNQNKALTEDNGVDETYSLQSESASSDSVPESEKHSFGWALGLQTQSQQLSASKSNGKSLPFDPEFDDDFIDNNQLQFHLADIGADDLSTGLNPADESGKELPLDSAQLDPLLSEGQILQSITDWRVNFEHSTGFKTRIISPISAKTLEPTQQTNPVFIQNKLNASTGLADSTAILTSQLSEKPGQLEINARVQNTGSNTFGLGVPIETDKNNEAIRRMPPDHFLNLKGVESVIGQKLSMANNSNSRFLNLKEGITMFSELIGDKLTPQHTYVATPLSTSLPASQSLIDDPFKTQTLVLHGRNWQNQFSQRIQWMTRNGIERADIRLDPEELGPIHLKISQRNGETQIVVHAQHPQTRDLMEQHQDKLRELLNQQGVRLSEFSVGSQQKDHHTGSDAAQDDGLQDSIAAVTNSVSDSGEDHHPLSMLVNVNGRLDYFV